MAVPGRETSFPAAGGGGVGQDWNRHPVDWLMSPGRQVGILLKRKHFAGRRLPPLS